MKIGLIIVFRNNENEIDTKFIVDYSNKIKHIELCFVNNESNDNTYKLLKEIKNKCHNISLVNIKKFKSHNTAVRAGARYMFNEFRLDHLGYVNVNDLKRSNINLKVVLTEILTYKKQIIQLDTDIGKAFLVD